MDRTDCKQQAISELNELKDEYDLTSIYLHGSILMDDFDPETSDIDSVGLVNGDRSLSVEDAMRDQLSDRLGIRLLFRDELDKGIRRGRLAGFIHPAVLLYDFPDWEHVTGEKHEQSDFGLAPIDHSDVLHYRLQKIQSSPGRPGEDWERPETIPEDRFTYYLKNLARLIHTRQSMRHGQREPFSYRSLKKAASPDEEPVVDAILNIRKTRDYSDFQQHIPLFRTFVNDMLDPDRTTAVERSTVTN